jgi:TonB family protein
MPREAKRRGAGREKRWAEFRAAIENYIAGVKPGNQTALNAAADPFAAYLAAFHRNLHTEFVHEFIASLPSSGALADDSLVAKVEIVVNPDGTLDRVGVVKSSGNLMYDFGAFNAVQRGAPYPPPPEKIRSPDGRTYLRWALHRDQSQCGTWNAEPYILKNPPRSPNDPKQDNVSPYRPAGTGDEEHGRRVPGEPGKGGGHAPAVSPGDTLGRLFPRRRIDLLARGLARFDPPV